MCTIPAVDKSRADKQALSNKCAADAIRGVNENFEHALGREQPLGNILKLNVIECHPPSRVSDGVSHVPQVVKLVA